MRVRILHFNNFDGAGGRINPAGVTIVNPVPIVDTFAWGLDYSKVPRPVGVATVAADDQGLLAELVVDLRAVAGRFPAAVLKFDERDERAIPRTVRRCQLLAIGMVDSNRDPRILPLPGVMPAPATSNGGTAHS